MYSNSLFSGKFRFSTIKNEFYEMDEQRKEILVPIYITNNWVGLSNVVVKLSNWAVSYGISDLSIKDLRYYCIVSSSF